MNIISGLPPPLPEGFLCLWQPFRPNSAQCTKEYPFFNFFTALLSDCLFLEMFTDVTLQLWKACSKIR